MAVGSGLDMVVGFRSVAAAALLLGIGSSPLAQAQTTFFVNGNCGDDAWSGLSSVCVGPSGPKRTIQAGMGLAQNGDTVVVADGLYTGAGNKGLFFQGQPFTLRSESGPESCVIDLENLGSAFFFVADEPPEFVIDGFTVRNGNGFPGGAAFLHHDADATFVNCIFRDNTSALGGAIYAENSTSATFLNCLFMNNHADFGGALYLTEDIDPTFLNCTFIENTAAFDGGAVYTAALNPRLINCLMTGNSAGGNGGGIAAAAGTALVVNCTLSDNAALAAGGGLSVQGPGALTFANGVLWEDQAPLGMEVAVLDHPSLGGGTLTLRYSDFEGGALAAHVDPGSSLNLGNGNLDTDPFFVSTASGDFGLSPGSPAVDAGNNADVPPNVTEDLDGGSRFLDGNADAIALVDMGALEFEFCQVDLGFGGPGTATLGVCGEPLLTGNHAELRLTGGPALQPAFLLAGFANNPTSFAGGTLVPVPPFLLVALGTNAEGEISFAVMGGQGPATVFIQGVVVDPLQPLGFVISNAVQVDVLP